VVWCGVMWCGVRLKRHKKQPQGVLLLSHLFGLLALSSEDEEAQKVIVRRVDWCGVERSAIRAHK
jgi:hypothetical protein